MPRLPGGATYYRPNAASASAVRRRLAGHRHRTKVAAEPLRKVAPSAMRVRRERSLLTAKQLLEKGKDN